jgi:agmatine/peptidylarginine deiminase
MTATSRPLSLLTLFFSILLAGAALLAADAPAVLTQPEFVAPHPQFHLAGEFERQDAILLAWDESDPAAQLTQIEIIRAIWKRVPVILLVSSADAQVTASAAMRQAGLGNRAVRFVRVAVDTVWARDYGPAAVKSPLGVGALINAEYERAERPNDDDVPLAVAPLLGMQTVEAPLRIEGGNLLSNGAGICVTTRKVLDDNAGRGYDEADVARLLKSVYGARETLILEPLVGEPTGHVDMFATFTAVDHVIVGECSTVTDPVNADLLDRNARRLAQLSTPRGPMRVTRIPMPPPEFEVWRTYTNVLYANGTLLVPVYPGADILGRRQALAVYRQALPGWKVKGIDCSDLIQSGGALHCVSMNLSRIARLPESTPLDGRPDPIQQFPFAAAERTIIAADVDDEAEFPGAAPWHGERRFTASGRPVAGSRRMAQAHDGRQRGRTRERFEEDVWELDEPAPSSIGRHFPNRAGAAPTSFVPTARAIPAGTATRKPDAACATTTTRAVSQFSAIELQRRPFGGAVGRVWVDRRSR